MTIGIPATLSGSVGTSVGVSEDEAKLLTLLHMDSAGSRTWFLDACGQTTHRKGRSLLTNEPRPWRGDPGADTATWPEFGDALPELFAGEEMGRRDARAGGIPHRVAAIRCDVADEIPYLCDAIRLARALVGTPANR